MTDRPPPRTLFSEASNDRGGLEPLEEVLPSIPPPPTYQEVVAFGSNNASLPSTYPPQYLPDPIGGQDELPSYEAGHEPTLSEDSLVLLLFSGIPPFIYESFLKNGVRGKFRLTGARILNLFGWAIGITTATLGLRNQAIPSSVLAAILVIFLYVLEKYKEDCHEFAPWLFEQDYKTHVVHGGFWAAQVLISWYSPLMTMRHVGEVYINTRGAKRGPEDIVAVLFLNLSIFGLFLAQAYLGRWVMVKWEFPASLRPLGRRHPLYLLVVEEAIILVPRLIICVAIYGALQLGAPSFRMSSKLWALESQQAAQASPISLVSLIPPHQ